MALYSPKMLSSERLTIYSLDCRNMNFWNTFSQYAAREVGLNMPWSISGNTQWLTLDHALQVDGLPI
jgi:hypothetical protein